jgi:hypothetical protein
LLSLKVGQTHQQPGGKSMVYLGHQRVGLHLVLCPAQLQQPGAHLASADSGMADGARPQATLMRLASEALGTGGRSGRTG